MGLVESLPPQEREALERQARERWGELDPEELARAVLELVVRRYFGPASLCKYGGDRCGGSPGSGARRVSLGPEKTGVYRLRGTGVVAGWG